MRLALVTSVTWTPPCGPPVRCQIRKVSIFPNSRSPASACARAPATSSQNPANLQATEIGGEWKAGLGAIAILSATHGELGYRGSHARVLPDNRVVHGLATFPVPDDRGFALVGDPDCGQIFGPQPARFHCFMDDILRAAPDFLRVVLNPSRLGIDLLVLSLSCAHDASGTIEHDETRTGRSLVNGANVICHSWVSSCRGRGLPWRLTSSANSEF